MRNSRPSPDGRERRDLERKYERCLRHDATVFVSTVGKFSLHNKTSANELAADRLRRFPKHSRLLHYIGFRIRRSIKLHDCLLTEKQTKPNRPCYNRQKIVSSVLDSTMRVKCHLHENYYHILREPLHDSCSRLRNAPRFAYFVPSITSWMAVMFALVFMRT